MAETPLSQYQSAQYDNNVEREGEDTNTCILCGKRIHANIDAAPYVHLTTGNALTDEETHPDSQGYFPVGPECKFKLPKNYLHKI